MMTRELTSVCKYTTIIISIQSFFFIIQTPIRDKQQQQSTIIRTLPSDERINRTCKAQSQFP